MFNDSEFTEKELYFAIYCITVLSCNWNMSQDDVYRLLTEKTKILNEYIIKYYDGLHTQGEDYIVSEITELIRSKGIEI